MGGSLINCYAVFVMLTNLSSAIKSNKFTELGGNFDIPGNDSDPCLMNSSLDCYPYDKGELCQCPQSDFRGILKCNKQCSISAVLDCQLSMCNIQQRKGHNRNGRMHV